MFILVFKVVAFLGHYNVNSYVNSPNSQGPCVGKIILVGIL